MHAQRASRAYEIPIIPTSTNNDNDKSSTILSDVKEVKLGEHRAVVLVNPAIVISPFAVSSLVGVGFSIIRSWLLG